MDRRIIFSDNGTLTDYSSNLESYTSGEMSFTITASQSDAIYIGSTLPFNHIYIKASTTSAAVSEVSVYHWDSDEFKEMVDVIDETKISGATLAQSGFITWVPNKDNGYSMEDTDDIAELSDITIYDRYWTKLTFSADMTAAISWAGNLFSDDDDLKSEFNALLDTDLMDAIETGKTNYQEEAKVAADTIIKDLVNQQVINDSNQLLNRSDLRLASVQKVAEIIYRKMEGDYEAERSLADLDYTKKLKRAFPVVDKNKDGRETPRERIPRHGSVHR